MQLMVKPMALDPLFWDIADIAENNTLPLSFRARGAWVLRPVTFLGPILLDIEEPDTLARQLLEWTNEFVFQALQTASVQQMLDDLPDPGDPRCSRALAVCLNILNGDLDQAMRICQMEGGCGGGFPALHPDGSSVNFIDQARDWIARRQQNLPTRG
jgi:hypothetical protein